MGNIIDDGRTLVGKAARVMPGKQAAGVWKIMRNMGSIGQDPDIYKDIQRFRAGTPRWDLYRKFWRRGDGNTLILSRVGTLKMILHISQQQSRLKVRAFISLQFPL